MDRLRLCCSRRLCNICTQGQCGCFLDLWFWHHHRHHVHLIQVSVTCDAVPTAVGPNINNTHSSLLQEANVCWHRLCWVVPEPFLTRACFSGPKPLPVEPEGTMLLALQCCHDCIPARELPQAAQRIRQCALCTGTFCTQQLLSISPAMPPNRCGPLSLLDWKPPEHRRHAARCHCQSITRALPCCCCCSAPSAVKPLERTKWLAYAAAFFNKEYQASLVYNAIKDSYLGLRREALAQRGTPPLVCWVYKDWDGDYAMTFSKYKVEYVNVSQGRASGEGRARPSQGRAGQVACRVEFSRHKYQELRAPVCTPHNDSGSCAVCWVSAQQSQHTRACSGGGSHRIHLVPLQLQSESVLNRK